VDSVDETGTEAPYDPFAVEAPERTFAHLRRLRAVAPVVTLTEGMHYVTSYDEARQVLRDTEHFSNALGFRAPGVEVPAEDRMLGEQDAPQHTRVRRVVISAFNPAAIKREVGFVRKRAHDLLAALPPSGTVDMVPAFTNPLPNDATVHLLGFPMEDSAQIAAWSKEVMESEWPAMNRTERGDGMAGAFPEYTAYVDTHIARARQQVGLERDLDTFTTRLVNTEVDGQHLSDRQVRALVFNALLGGLTTTAQLLGTMIHQLLTTDSVSELLGADQDERARFIEECLRVYPPVMIIPRGCVRQTEVAGTTIQAGDRVIVGTACVNRDERQFDDSEVFAADREQADRHLTFGFGPHLCAGAAMARSVASVGLDEFLCFAQERRARLSPGFAYETVPTFFEYGPKSLPVVLGDGA
jgi:cytochrome P450